MCTCTGESLYLDRCPSGKRSPVDRLVDPYESQAKGLWQVMPPPQSPLGNWPIDPASSYSVPLSFLPSDVSPENVVINKNPDGTINVTWEE